MKRLKGLKINSLMNHYSLRKIPDHPLNKETKLRKLCSKKFFFKTTHGKISSWVPSPGMGILLTWERTNHRPLGGSHDDGCALLQPWQIRKQPFRFRTWTVAIIAWEACEKLPWPWGRCGPASLDNDFFLWVSHLSRLLNSGLPTPPRRLLHQE